MSLTPLTLGFLPLVDASPLIVPETLGFAAEEGLDLTLLPAPSWANLRDMLAQGQVVAAQMLAPLPVASALDLGGSTAALEALMVLNMGGDSIGVSTALAQRMREQGHGFDFADARAAGLALLSAAGDQLRIGVPFPFSMHMELIRYWLDGLGRALPAGLEISTVPPPRMAEALAAGEIDAFCVGEPRGSVAAQSGAGVLLLPSSAIWSFAPEKVLATQAGWADAEPDLAGRLMRAVWRAGRWLGQTDNVSVASELLSASHWLAVSAEVIERVLSGHLVIGPSGEERHAPRFIEFHTGAANFP